MEKREGREGKTEQSGLFYSFLENINIKPYDKVQTSSGLTPPILGTLPTPLNSLMWIKRNFHQLPTISLLSLHNKIY